MGSKNKLKRFKENETFANVIQPTREEVVNDFSYKGKWHSFFKNNNPIVLELGCGKGEYTIALAQKNPDKNYIGIDIKGLVFGAEPKLQLKKTCPMLLLSERRLSWLVTFLLKMKSMRFGLLFPIHRLSTSAQNIE